MRVRASALLLALAVASCGTSGQQSHTPAPVKSPTPPALTARPLANVYVHYYLWWTVGHWHSKLGPSYPYSQPSPPRPGAINSVGCQPTVKFPGATIVDLPGEGLYDQALAATFDRHIAAAAAAGIRGFLASWKGSGQASQDPGVPGYDQRLELLVARVNAYNRTHSKHFGLGLALAAFGDYNRSAADITGDLAYFSQRYGKDPAFKNDYSAKPVVMWLDSRKYKVETVRDVSTAARPSVYLLGDETATSWPRDSPFLDGTSYYWSTQNPQSRFSRSSIASLAAAVHAAGKPWLAPFIAGYNKELAGGGCVPRNGTRTLDDIWAQNATSQPDGWFGISWNEFVENTYIEPSQAYGTTYLDELKRLISVG